MDSDDQRHGTRAGYIAHRRANQPACTACKRAEAAYQTARYRDGASARRTAKRSHTHATCVQCFAGFEPLPGQKYCSAECRGTARNKRRRDASPNAIPEIVLFGMAYRFGAFAPKQKAIKCRVPVGVMAYCPNCDSIMGGVSQHHRVCRGCATEVLLNPEEVEAACAGLITA